MYVIYVKLLRWSGKSQIRAALPVLFCSHKMDSLLIFFRKVRIVLFLDKPLPHSLDETFFYSTSITQFLKTHLSLARSLATVQSTHTWLQQFYDLAFPEIHMYLIDVHREKPPEVYSVHMDGITIQERSWLRKNNLESPPRLRKPKMK